MLLGEDNALAYINRLVNECEEEQDIKLGSGWGFPYRAGWLYRSYVMGVCHKLAALQFNWITPPTRVFLTPRKKLEKLYCIGVKILFLLSMTDKQVNYLISNKDVLLSYDSDGTLIFPPQSYFGFKEDDLVWFESLFLKCIKAAWELSDVTDVERNIIEGLIPEDKSLWSLLIYSKLAFREGTACHEASIASYGATELAGEDPNPKQKLTFASYAKHRAHYVGKQKHYFHIVTNSPWPLYSSIGALMLTFGLVMYMHNYFGGGIMAFFGFFLILCVMALWWRDVIRESTFAGYHTEQVQRGIRLGVVLFIISELMLFFSFFWAFFHSSLSPSVVLGSVWPPIGINTLNPIKIPLLNTLILLLSGLTLTCSHHIIRIPIWHDLIYGYKDKDWPSNRDFWWKSKQLWKAYRTGRSNELLEFKRLIDEVTLYIGDEICCFTLYLTIFLGLEFTAWQAYEYYQATFYIYDGVYGSTFYMTTGLHGLHVIVGTLFLIVCYIRLRGHHFTSKHHLGYEAAIWYWHFVDVVWIFLFLAIYCWGSGIESFFK
jgi:cytochrome c oxidase subunit 3